MLEHEIAESQLKNIKAYQGDAHKQVSMKIIFSFLSH